jgi:hypothetical protein
MGQTGGDWGCKQAPGTSFCPGDWGDTSQVTFKYLQHLGATASQSTGTLWRIEQRSHLGA